MNETIKVVLETNACICKNIKNNNSSDKRGILSQNILSNLRNFVEAINFYFYSKNYKFTLEYNYPNIQNANAYVGTIAKLNILNRFHKLLQCSVSHYTPNEENSERLMLKYYEYLLTVKKLMKTENINVLENINDFPLNIDYTLQEYYSKISEKIEKNNLPSTESKYKYYIQKIKPFFVGEEIYYEITFFMANDNANKFNRIIAFTKKIFYQIMLLN